MRVHFDKQFFWINITCFVNRFYTFRFKCSPVFLFVVKTLKHRYKNWFVNFRSKKMSQKCCFFLEDIFYTNVYFLQITIINFQKWCLQSYLLFYYLIAQEPSVNKIITRIRSVILYNVKSSILGSNQLLESNIRRRKSRNLRHKIEYVFLREWAKGKSCEKDASPRGTRKRKRNFPWKRILVAADNLWGMIRPGDPPTKLISRVWEQVARKQKKP